MGSVEEKYAGGRKMPKDMGNCFWPILTLAETRKNPGEDGNLMPWAKVTVTGPVGSSEMVTGGAATASAENAMHISNEHHTLIIIFSPKVKYGSSNSKYTIHIMSVAMMDDLAEERRLDDVGGEKLQ